LCALKFPIKIKGVGSCYTKSERSFSVTCWPGGMCLL
jgi:hypothetical protein